MGKNTRNPESWSIQKLERLILAKNTCLEKDKRLREKYMMILNRKKNQSKLDKFILKTQ